MLPADPLWFHFTAHCWGGGSGEGPGLERDLRGDKCKHLHPTPARLSPHTRIAWGSWLLTVSSHPADTVLPHPHPHFPVPVAFAVYLVVAVTPWVTRTVLDGLEDHVPGTLHAM